MEMSVHTSSSLPTTSDLIGQHLQVVHSYFREDDAIDGSLQKRAYSVGSKPPTGKPLSTGSYVDMSVGGSGGLQHSLKDDGEKSCSAPHLNDEVCRPQSGGSVGTEVSDLLMELDFNRKSSDSTATAAKDFRTRASSGGARDSSQRKLSHNAKDALSRITFFHRGGGSGSAVGTQDAARRPRTSTICQESLRPRTSSFGTADDSRPRSSSGGNTRFRDVFGTPDGLHGVRHFAQRRLTSKRASVESSADSLAAGAEYLDMMCGGQNSRASTVQAAPTPQQQQLDPYMVMRPGSSNSKLSDNFEKAKSHIPAAGDQSSRVLPESVVHLSSSQSAYTVDSADRKSTDMAEVLSSASTSTSREVNLPVPFEVGISFQSLHYTAMCPPESTGSTAIMSKPLVTSAAAVPVATSSSSTSVSIATSSPADVSYATLDIHSLSVNTAALTTTDTPTRSTEVLYRGTPHAFAEIDFSQSSQK